MTVTGGTGVKWEYTTAFKTDVKLAWHRYGLGIDQRRAIFQFIENELIIPIDPTDADGNSWVGESGTYWHRLCYANNEHDGTLCEWIIKFRQWSPLWCRAVRLYRYDASELLDRLQ